MNTFNKLLCLITISASSSIGIGSSFTKLNGFHITVKESNQNQVNSINDWNHDSKYLKNTINGENPLNINFDNFDQLITNKWKNNSEKNNSKSNTILSEGYSELNKILTSNPTQFHDRDGFAELPYGHTGLMTNQLIIPYLETKNQVVNNGLLATINENSTLNTMMEVPYNLNPSQKLINDDIGKRARTYPIGPFINETSEKIVRAQELVVYVHPKFDNNKLGLTITTNDNNDISSKIVKTNKQNTFSWAILNQDYNNNNLSTKYTIQWNDATGAKIAGKDNVQINIASSTHDITIHNPDNTSTPLLHNYLTTDEESNPQIIDFSQIKSKALLTPENSTDDNWTYQAVNSDLTPKGNKYEIKSDGITLKINDGSESTSYLLEMKNKNEKIVLDQYLTLYKNTPANYPENLKDFTNTTTGANFIKYLKTQINFNGSLNSLTAGQFNYWFLFYNHDLKQHLYANINTSNDADNPWALSSKLKTITLVNNWNIIIIGGVLLVLFISIPIIIFLVRRTKRLK